MKLDQASLMRFKQPRVRRRRLRSWSLGFVRRRPENGPVQVGELMFRLRATHPWMRGRLRGASFNDPARAAVQFKPEFWRTFSILSALRKTLGMRYCSSVC